MIDPFVYLVRFLHIGSAVVLLGGIFYAWNLSKSGKLSGNPADGFQPSMLILGPAAAGHLRPPVDDPHGAAAVPEFYHTTSRHQVPAVSPYRGGFHHPGEAADDLRKRARLLTGRFFGRGRAVAGYGAALAGN
jgi:hypothetical protein